MKTCRYCKKDITETKRIKFCSKKCSEKYRYYFKGGRQLQKEMALKRKERILKAPYPTESKVRMLAKVELENIKDIDISLLRNREIKEFYNSNLKVLAEMERVGLKFTKDYWTIRNFHIELFLTSFLKGVDVSSIEGRYKC